MNLVKPAAGLAAALLIGLLTYSGPHPRTAVAAGNASQIVAGVPDVRSVMIAGFAYLPDPITVSAGMTIIWTNSDTVMHSATADDGSFDTGLFGQDGSGSVTFTVPGTFTYTCSIHPFMHGTVIVQ